MLLREAVDDPRLSGSTASGEERIDPVRSAASLVRSTVRSTARAASAGGAARAGAGVAFHE